MPRTTTPTALSAERWQRVSACFEQALETPVDTRARFVESTLADDPESCREVFDMLKASGDLGLLESDAGSLFATGEGGQSDNALPPGALVGAYRIVERVGQGGMGDVYRAERSDGVFEQQVAIKMLRGGLWGDALVRRFEMERHILARLRHPDIVGIIDGGTTDDARPYLVMPYIDGRPITDDCEARSADLPARLRLVARVANAVQYAHTRLIVHRDIKPSNILVTTDGEVRLLDFGIAKLLNDDSDGRSSTRSTYRMFTPEYGAPEQIAGLPVTAAADVYALGVLLYQLVCGVRPHVTPGRPLRELEEAILKAEVAPPSTVSSSYPWRTGLRGDLDHIILKALRKEPDRRYATAAQFAEDIERFLTGLPVHAVRDSASYRARRFIKRHRAGVIVSATVALTLAGVAVLTTVQARRLSLERDRVQREQIATNTVVNLLQSLFAQSNPGVNPGGDSLRVSQVLDVGESMVDSLSSQPLVQARMWRTLGNMHFSRGRPDRAKALLWRAYERYRTASGADSLDVISTLHEYARVVDYYDGRIAALPILQETVTRLRNVVPANSPDLRVAERELGERLLDAKARRAELERMVKGGKGTAVSVDSMERASDLNALAVEQFNAGEFREALALFTEVFDILTAKLPASHPDRLQLMGNVAATRDRLGDYAGAEALARELVAQRRANNPVAPIPLGAALEYLAMTTARRGYLSDADSLMREVMELRASSVLPTHLHTIRGFQNRSLIAMARGRLDDAVAFSDSAAQRLRMSTTITPNDRLAARIRRAQVLTESGRIEQANAELNAISASVRSTFPAPHPNSNLLEMGIGTLALLQGQSQTAIDAFAAAAANMEKRLPPTHPELAGARCGQGLALSDANRRDEAKPLLEACKTYKQYGLASPTLRLRAQKIAG